MEFTIQNQNNIDNQTIISELSDEIDMGTTTSSFIFDDKLCEVKTNVNIELNKLNLDNLKDKCKELGITGISKMKKPELVQLLENEIIKCIDVLKEKKIADLKNMCKACSIKKIGSKKEVLIYQILAWNSVNMVFRIDETKFQNTTISEPIKENNDETTNANTNDKPLTLIEQLEKQKQEIELKMQAELKKQQEEEQIKKEEEQRKQEEEIRKQEELRAEEEKKRIEEEKKEAKKKKQAIPKNVRVIVWNHYIGEDIIKHRCLCCKKVVISNTNFEVGHVLSEKNGGTHEINNLRPICFACNHSMGPENMIDFVVKFGLYIG
jgi:5-methylcytosine-specific restriction endonuclease McrA